MTTVGDKPHLEVESALLLKDLQVPGLAWWWEVRYGPGIPNIKEFRLHVPVLLHTCEGQTVTDPRLITPTSDDEQTAVEWYMTSPVNITGHAETNRPGAIDVLPAASGGAVDEELAGLCDWIQSRLDSGHLPRHTAKLARSGLSEQHLFLVIHESAAPFSIFYGLAFGSEVPECAFELPGSLSHVWLLTGWKQGGVLMYSVCSGWTRRYPFN